MKPETVSAACATIFVACIVVALVMAMAGVKVPEAYIGAVGLSVMALFVSATQPET